MNGYWTTCALLGALLLQFVAAQTPYITLDNVAWNKQYRAVDGSKQVNIGDVCRDLAGNTFAVGYSIVNFEFHTTMGGSTGFVMKFGADGTRLWIRFLDSLAYDEVNTCRADSAGGVVVSGRTNGYLSTFNELRTYSTSYAEAFVSRFDASGSLLWTKQISAGYVGASYSDITAGKVSVDADNNVFLPVAYYNSYWSVKAAKLWANGTVAWSTRVGAPSGHTYLRWTSRTLRPDNNHYTWDPLDSEEYGKVMDCNAFGDCFLAVNTNGAVSVTVGGPSAGGYDMYLTRLDTTGQVVWTTVVGSAADDFAQVVKLDVFGNPWLAGSVSGPVAGERFFGQEDCAVFKFNPSGQRLFARVFGSVQRQTVFAMDADAQGSMYLAIEQVNNVASVPNADFFDGITLPFINHAFAVVTMMDSFGNRIFSTPLRSGQPAGGDWGYLNLMPQAISVNPAGDQIVVAGKFAGVFDEPFTPFPTLPYVQSGFLVAGNLATTCSNSDFDSVMTEINDLLYTMGA